MTKDTLFTDNFCDIKSDEELQILQNKYEDDDKYDRYYVASGCIKHRREIFDKLFQKSNKYLDRSFFKQYKKKYNFHQRTREMYLICVFLDKKIIITPPSDEGPDIITSDNIYIECIAPTSGSSDNGNSVPDPWIGVIGEERYMQTIPEDQMILRITNSIANKIQQYDKRSNKSRFCKDSPYIIAINTGSFRYNQEYLGIPLIIKAVFGLEYLEIDKNNNKSFRRRDQIKKTNSKNSDILVNYFTNNSFDFISGIIFSSKLVINHPKQIGDDCIFVNNPFAKNPVPKEFSSKFTHS